MNIRAFALLATASVAAFPSAGFAADSALYAKVYGGITVPNDLVFEGLSYPLDAGYLLGASIGVGTGLEGLSVELDLNHSSANYTGHDNYLKATSLFGNLVYTVSLTEAFEVYGGAGLGAAYVQYDNGYDNNYDSDGTAFVGQVFAGVGTTLADNISLFGELRYQSAFGDVAVEESGGYGYDLEFARTSVLVGLKFAM
jgi:opacity protein-like surface antigen